VYQHGLAGRLAELLDPDYPAVLAWYGVRDGLHDAGYYGFSRAAHGLERQQNRL
jgi:hypothetical protein